MSEAPVRSPRDLRGLTLEQLQNLAQDLRQRILSVSLKNGGHLGASLGTVELAIALHYVFESPTEPIIWDVGHQAYAHKLLTGRWESFETLRMHQGVSGFLSRVESPHDAFGAGHSSTSISAALASAWAKRKDKKAWTVAVIGDGGLTAGLAYEALNNVKAIPQLGPLLVVLNDNQMSISENIGAIPAILASDRAKDFFELFGFDYFGPVDGHDLNALTGTLRGIKLSHGSKPVLLHVFTQKGKGYSPAEEQPANFHGVNAVKEKVPGKQTPPVAKSYSDTFGDALIKLAEKDPKIVAITAAMPEGTGLTRFAQKFPDRFFDVGIAEPHAVTFAAGLATQGYKPVVAIYSTFLQRALDACIHDVAIQKLGVTFAIDRAGIVGADGPTHHGLFDLAYLGAIPGFTITAPSNLADVFELLNAGITSGQPYAIRYPRGSSTSAMIPPLVGGMRTHREVKNPLLIVAAFGAAVERTQKALELLGAKAESISFYSTPFFKPISAALVAAVANSPEATLVTIEDAAIHGGFGQNLAGSLAPSARKLVHLGYGDEFIEHGSPSALEEAHGMSPPKIAERLAIFLAHEKAT